jgi:nucleoid-associated protein YgaU
MESARPAISQVEIRKPVENIPAEKVQIETDSKTETERDSRNKSAAESGEADSHASGAKEFQANLKKQEASRPEQQRKESEAAPAAVSDEPASTAAQSEAVQRGHKETAEQSTGKKSKQASGIGENESHASLPQTGVAAMEKVQLDMPNPSISIFQRSGQVWRRIFRKGAFSYGLVLLLGLAFLWPNRHLTAVRATPAIERVESAPEPEVKSPNTAEAATSKPKDKAPVTVVVQADETLSSLAQRHIGTYNEEALAKIQALNPAIKDPNLIVVGQKIQMPHTARETNESTAPATDQQVPR